jgi:hypothetical protein
MADQIRDLGLGGMMADPPPAILPMNVFTDCNNVRFTDNSVQTINGETTNYTVAISPDYGIHWRRPDQGYNIFAKNGNIVRVDANGSASSMFSSAATKYNNSDWQGCTFNGGFAIILNNGKSTPLYCLYGDPVAGTTFQELPGWNYYAGLTVTAKVVRSLNYSLIAANFTIDQSGTITNAPGTIRVSVQATTGNIPSVWQPGYTTDTADEFELSSTSPVLDMLELRGKMYVYSQDSISVVSISNSTQVARYSNSYGILTTDAVIEIDGNHFVVDRNDVYIHNGSGKIDPILEGKNKRYFYNNINLNAIDKLHLVKYSKYKEVWICYPKGSSTTCNEALIYNYKYNTWYKRSLNNITYSFVGPYNLGSSFYYGSEEIFMTTNSTQVLMTAPVYTMWNGTGLSSYVSYVEKKGINPGTAATTLFVDSMYLSFDQIASGQNIKVRVAGQNNPTEVIDLSIDGTGTHANDTFICTPESFTAQGYKVDPRVNGRILNYRIQADSGYWRLALMEFDIKPAGRR